MYETNVPGLGTWGGTCRCPDGSEYQVADKDGGKGLQCENGEKVGDIKQVYGAWSKNKVTCTPGKKINVCNDI